MAESAIVDVPQQTYGMPAEVAKIKLGPGRWEVTWSAREDTAVVFARRLLNTTDDKEAGQ